MRNGKIFSINEQITISILFRNLFLASARIERVKSLSLGPLNPSRHSVNTTKHKRLINYILVLFCVKISFTFRLYKNASYSYLTTECALL